MTLAPESLAATRWCVEPLEKSCTLEYVLRIVVSDVPRCARDGGHGRTADGGLPTSEKLESE